MCVARASHQRHVVCDRIEVREMLVAKDEVASEGSMSSMVCLWFIILISLSKRFDRCCKWIFFNCSRMREGQEACFWEEDGISGSIKGFSRLPPFTLTSLLR